MEPRLLLAAVCAGGVMLLGLAVVRISRRSRMQTRLRQFDLLRPEADAPPAREPRGVRTLVRGLGVRLGERWPAAMRGLTSRVDGAGLRGGILPAELLGWKVVLVAAGLALGLVGLVQYGLAGAGMLLLTTSVGWFGIDLALARQRARRQRLILRHLPTIMDLLVLSLEAGMGLNRALRTVVTEYRSPLGEEIQRVLSDIELGMGRAEAFERMAARLGMEDLRSLSRAIIQSDELGTSLVTVMQGQGRDVRLSRRRAAEAEAMQAPIKMLFPLVLFILPTLFMLLLGPVGLRASAALSGVGSTP